MVNLYVYELRIFLSLYLHELPICYMGVSTRPCMMHFCLQAEVNSSETEPQTKSLASYLLVHRAVGTA